MTAGMFSVAWAISYNRKKFPWRTVIWGVILQFVLALFILKTPWGEAFFGFAGKAVNKLNDFASDGTKQVFGAVADQKYLSDKFDPAHSFVLGIVIVGTIIIVACVSSLLYHWGILQKVVHAAAWVMRKVMGTSGSGGSSGKGGSGGKGGGSGLRTQLSGARRVIGRVEPSLFGIAGVVSDLMA